MSGHIIDCTRFRRPDANFAIGTVRISDVVLVTKPERSVTIELARDDIEDDLPGHLALPPNTSPTTIGQIKAHAHKAVVVLWDSESACVHMLFLGRCLFLVFTRMLWTSEYQLEPGRVSLAPLKPPQAPDPVNCRALLDRHCVVRCGVLATCGGAELDEDDQLQPTVFTSDGDAALDNTSQCLLMPHNMDIKTRLALAQQLHERPVPVIYDQYGRVYYALLNGCTHLVTMPCWTQMAQQRTVTRITGLSRATTADTLDSLLTPYMVGDETTLWLPRLPPAFYQQWQPRDDDGGPYIVYYTSDNKVMRILRRRALTADEIEEEWDEEALRRLGMLETDIDLQGWWDTRYSVKRPGVG
jgi:hypothetical protein